MSEISRSLFCECGHSIRFHHDGKGIYAKGCNQPLGMGMECPCTLDWGTSQPTDQIRDLTAELKELREFVGAMNPGSEICFKGVVFHLCLDGKWRSDMARSGTSGNMRYVHQGYDTALDAWRKMNAGEGE